MREQRLPAPGPEAYDVALRAGFLRVALLGAAILAAAYLLLGGVGLLRPRFFPWDGVLGVALVVVCAALYRQGKPQGISFAASWLVAGVNVLTAFYSQAYGVRHPVTAVYLVGIVLGGMLIGGWFLRLWSALGGVFVFAWALLELRGELTPAGDAVSSWPELWQTVLFWWTLMAVTAWLVEQFAYNLERAVQLSRAQTAALTRSVEALAGQPEPEGYLRGLLAAMAQQLGAAEATLFLVDEAEERLAPQLAYREGRVQEGAVVDEGAAVNGAAAAAADFGLWQALRERREAMVLEDGQGAAMLITPLLQEGRVSGFFSIWRDRQRPFAASEVELAQALAQQATLAMQLAQLAQEQERGAVAAERNRLAREIHDTLAQGFTGILIQLEAAEDVMEGGSDGAQALQHLARARTLARDSLNEARRSVQALRPQALEGQDLPAALRELAQRSSGGVAVRLTVAGAPRPLPPTVAAELLRIAQEAVHNAVRHGAAQTVEVALTYAPEALTLAVEDDGRGFEAGEVAGGFGLSSMRQRAELIGAQLTIDSRRGAGTRVVCRVAVVAGG